MRIVMLKKIGWIGLLFCGLLLSGCAKMNSKFDCPMKPGVMCESLDQVNAQVNQGTLGGTSTSMTPTCKNCETQKNKDFGNFTTPYPTIAMNPGDPVRYGETVLRIWMAPYEDKDGNYYQPTILYTVVKPGHWIGQPVKAITDEGDNS